MKFHVVGQPGDARKRIVFFCPGCSESHSIPVSAIAWKQGNREWWWNGLAEKPTVKPSIMYNVGRSNPTAHLCHSFVTDGKIQFLNDCTHHLRGKTVDLPEWEGRY